MKLQNFILLILSFIAWPSKGTASIDPNYQCWSIELPKHVEILIEREWDSTLVVYQKGEPVIRLEDHTFFPAQTEFDYARPWDASQEIRDLNGDDILDWVVIGWSGGAHCCRTVHVISLAETPYLLDSVDLEHSGFSGFEDIDEDGYYELRACDWSFAYWNTCFALSPAPEIILTLREDGFQLNPDLMRRPPPDPEEWKNWLSEIRHHPDWDSTNELPPPLLWARMLDLIYQGHPGCAELLVIEIWPNSIAGKKQFRDKFWEVLDSSQWFNILTTSLSRQKSNFAKE